MTNKEVAIVEEQLTNCIRAIESIDLSKKRSAERQKKYVERYHALNSELSGMQLLLQKLGYVPFYHFAKADDIWETPLSYYTVERMVNPHQRFFRFDNAGSYWLYTSEQYAEDYEMDKANGNTCETLDDYLDECVRDAEGLTEITREEYYELLPFAD